MISGMRSCEADSSAALPCGINALYQVKKIAEHIMRSYIKAEKILIDLRVK
jgi:hypothetical protein